MNTIVAEFTDVVKALEDIEAHDAYGEATDLFAYVRDNDDVTLDEVLNRRVNEREPTAYITKHCRFSGLDLYIDERVLVPRSETEALLQVGIDEANHGALVADVGTGSGAVALALKRARPDLKITGLDISKDALDVASINSATLDLNVEWRDADLLHGVKENFTVVLANLPYLPKAERDRYEPEMVEHEPQVALWGGDDGYDLMRELLSLAAARRAVELVALEIGRGTEQAVCDLVRNAGFPTVFCTSDSRGDTRAVVGKR